MTAILLDVHCHLVPIAAPRLATIPGLSWQAEAGVLDVDGHRLGLKSLFRPPDLLAWMERIGVAEAWVSAPPMVYRQQLDRAAAETWASYLNDGLREVAAAKADRLKPIFHLTVEHPVLAIATADKWIDAGHTGFAMASGAEHVMLSAKDYEPLWQRLDAAGAFLFLHPPESCDARLEPFYLQNLLGNPYETAVAAAHLIFAGVADRYPNIRFCLAHCGGATAMIAGRLERGVSTKRPGIDPAMGSPRQGLKRFFVDCIAHDPEALAFAETVFGPDRIVYGSDWPFPMGVTEPAEQLAALDPALRRRILTDNPQRLLRRLNPE